MTKYIKKEFEHAWQAVKFVQEGGKLFYADSGYRPVIGQKHALGLHEEGFDFVVMEGAGMKDVNEMEFGGVTYVAVDSDRKDCIGCEAYNKFCCVQLFCTNDMRDDGRNVIFKIKVQ